MAMVAGSVSVDDAGNATYTPDDDTNYAKFLFLQLQSDASTQTSPQTTVTPASVTFDTSGNLTIVPTSHTTAKISTQQLLGQNGGSGLVAQKQAQARVANTQAKLIDFLLAQAQVSITIAADATGDGLQTTTTAGNPTDHPATPKTLTGNLS